MAKGMTIFGANGEDYTINDPNIAPEFKASSVYSAGDFVTYEGTLYRLTAAHAANATWANTSKAAVKVGDRMKTLAEAVETEAAQRVLNDKKALADLAADFNAATVYSTGQYVIYQGQLYRLTAAHTANTSWANTEKESVTVGEELESHKTEVDSYMQNISETSGNMYSEGNITTYYNTELVDGQIINTQVDTKASLSMYAVATDDDTVVTVSIADTTVLGRNAIIITPSADCNGMILKNNGETTDQGIKFTVPLTANQPYAVSYTLVAGDPTTIGGVIIEKIQVEPGSAASAYSTGMTAVDAVARTGVAALEKELEDMIEPRNLYDKNAAVTEGAILLNDGTEQELEGYFYTDYIELPSPGVYTVPFTRSSPGVMYDEARMLIGPVYAASSSNSNPCVFETPDNARYVRFNIEDALRGSFALYKNNRLSGNEYGQKLLTRMFQESNLYNWRDVTLGSLLLDDGTITQNDYYALSGYIQIPGAGEYSVPYTFSSPGCIYDRTKTLIGKAYTHSTSSTEHTFTITNDNAWYIRLNMFVEDARTFRFCHGNKLTDVPYGAKMTQGLSVRAADVVGRWYGKKIVCFGDSRTWYDGQEYTELTKSEWTGKTCVGYQQTLAKLTGAKIDTQAASGDTSVQICTKIRAFDFTGYDAVFLEGGVNDFVKSSQVTIGAIAAIGSTFDTSTVYGAWQSAIEYILENYPRVKIFMDIPAIAWTAAGVFPYNTAKIKGEIAELYNLPCFDLYKKGGISVVNRDYYYCDNVSSTNWRLHFNDYGNALVGEILAGFINAN